QGVWRFDLALRVVEVPTQRDSAARPRLGPPKLNLLLSEPCQKRAEDLVQVGTVRLVQDHPAVLLKRVENQAGRVAEPTVVVRREATEEIEGGPTFVRRSQDRLRDARPGEAVGGWIFPHLSNRLAEEGALASSRWPNEENRRVG